MSTKKENNVLPQIGAKPTSGHFALLKRISSTPGFAVFLATITPFVFIFSHNAQMFRTDDLFIVSLFRILLAILFGGIIQLVALCFIDNKKMPRWVTILATAIICVFIFRWFFLLMYNPLQPIFERSSAVTLASIICGILVTPIVYKFSFKIFNGVLGILFIISAFTICYNTVLGSFQKKNNESFEHIAINLKSKPNIYVFMLESYNDLSMMRDIYNIDTKPLENFAHKNGFTIYEDVYSNGEASLMSTYRLYMMAMTDERTTGLLDASQGVRSVLGGGHDNRLLRYLKGQGYSTAAVYHPSPSYYAFEQEEMLDISNLSGMPAWAYMLSAGNEKIEHYYSRYLRRFHNVVRNLSLKEYVEETILSQEKQDKPRFFLFTGGAGHTSRISYTWKQEQEWIKTYPKLIERANQELFKIVDYIINKDENALIVLIGDHGPWRLRGAWEDALDNDLESLETTIKQNNVSAHAVIDDVFRVFLAVRMPKDFDQDISYGYTLSPVNLFRHIFSALNKDDTFLKDRVVPKSVLKDSVVYEDGEYLLQK